jgi:hypothetical protein
LRKNFGLSFLILLLFSSLPHTGCTKRDPGITYLGGVSVGNPRAPVSSNLMSAICGAINRCHPEVTADTCGNALVNVKGFAAPLGLSSTYDTLASIIAAEETGTLVGSASSSSSCGASISALDCASPIAQNAYIASSSTPFSGAVNMVSGGSCGEVFTASAQYSCSSSVFIRGAVNSPIEPKVSTTGYSYSVSPSLPAGLSLDPGSGIISGAPTVVSPAQAYTVTATRLGQSSTRTIQIRTADGYLVDDLGDAGNVGPGCRTAGGTCTLRAAVQAINSAPSPNVVVLPAGSISLGSQLLATASVDIYGDCEENTALDGQSAHRVIQIQTTGTVNLENLIFRNGRETAGAYGAGLFIDSTPGSVTVSVKKSAFVNNSGMGSGWYGGAVLSWLPNPVTLTFDTVKFDSNTVDSRGAAIFASSATNLTVKNSIFINNTATSAGGAIGVDGSANVSGSLFSVNSSTASSGGAIDFSGSAASTLTNNTFYNNSARRGGALYSVSTGGVDVTNCTLVNNHALDAGFGGGTDGSGAIRLFNSIVAQNTDSSGLNNCQGNPSSLGFNISDSAASACNMTQISDKVLTDPKLGPLQGNGGLSSTLIPLPGSPAIDQGSNSGCPATDQRGDIRPANGVCDIGAVEVH